MKHHERLFNEWREAERKAREAERLVCDESTRLRWQASAAPPSQARREALLLRAEANEKLRLALAQIKATAESIRRANQQAGEKPGDHRSERPRSSDNPGAERT